MVVIPGHMRSLWESHMVVFFFTLWPTHDGCCSDNALGVRAGALDMAALASALIDEAERRRNRLSSGSGGSRGSTPQEGSGALATAGGTALGSPAEPMPQVPDSRVRSAEGTPQTTTDLPGKGALSR